MKGKTLGIIGYGAFGSFIHELAKRHLPKLRIIVYSNAPHQEGVAYASFEEVGSVDIVIPAVPIHSFEETLQRIVAIPNARRVVVDVATVKGHTVNLFHQYKDQLRYVATHPMFGPYSYRKKGNSLRNLRLVICEHTLSEDELLAVEAFFGQLGILVLHLPSDEHDRLLAETLFLTHLVGQAVTVGNFRRTEIDTVSFGFLMDAVESVQNDTQLFSDVFAYNPYCREVLSGFRAALSTVEKHLIPDVQ